MAVSPKKRISPKVKRVPRKSVLSALSKLGNPKGTTSSKKITSYMKSVMTVEHYPGSKERKIRRAVRNELKKGYLKSKKYAMRGLPLDTIGLKRRHSRRCRTSHKRRRHHGKRRARHLVVLKRRSPRAPYGNRNLAIRHLHNHPFRKR